MIEAVTRRRPTVSLRASDGEALVERADVHRVAGYVHEALQPATILPDAARQRLSAMAMQAAAAHLQVLADLAALSTVLDDRGVRWCVLKGPAAVELLHRGPTLRRYHDLDVLVAAADLAGVVERLEEAGATVLDVHWATLAAWQHTQIHLRLWTGTTLDLHWHLLNEWYDRDAFAVDTDAVLDRVRRVDLGGVTAPTLDPADMLVHLCVHAATSGGQRLSWLRDIQLAAAAPGLDTSVLTARAEAGRAALVTATMLVQAAVALHDPGLARLARRISPSRPWTVLTHVAARVSPPVRWRGADHVTVGTVLCRSTRETPARSAVILARNLPRLARRWVTSAATRARLRPLRRALRGTQREDGQALRPVPGDGPHARPEYFRWVEATARDEGPAG